MRIRQIALVATDLEHALGDLRAVRGLGEPFADPGVGVFGLRNGVLPIGEQLLEVVSPAQAGTDAASTLAIARKRGLAVDQDGAITMVGTRFVLV